MAAGKKTQRQLDTLIRAADQKIEKYKGFIAKLNEEKKDLNAQKRALATEAKKAPAKKTAAGKKTAAKKTAVKRTSARKTPAKKDEPSLLEGIMDELKKGGLDAGDILDSLLGKK